MSRRNLLRGAAVLGAAGFLVPAGGAFATPRSAPGARITNSRRPTLFGALAGPESFPNADPTETKAQMRARVCKNYGVASLPVERIFNEGSWDVPAPGTPAIVSFSHHPAQVAAGQYDSEIRQFVESLDGVTRYWLCLNHECDQIGRNYTAAEQVEGFRHFSTVVRSVGMPKVKLTSIQMSWTLGQGGVDHWKDWYPGADYIDALGWDAYWRPKLPNSADDVYGPPLDAAREEGKRLLICETSMGAPGHGGTYLVGDQYVEIPEQWWTDFTAEAIDYLDGPDTAAVTWFETNKTDGHWLLQNHPEALASYKAAVNACTR